MTGLTKEDREEWLLYELGVKQSARPADDMRLRPTLDAVAVAAEIFVPPWNQAQLVGQLLRRYANCFEHMEESADRWDVWLSEDGLKFATSTPFKAKWPFIRDRPK